jgi:hypothetical protein
MTPGALATRCLSRSAMPPKQAEGEGGEPPRAGPLHPFRDGIPLQWQSFRKWPRQASNPHLPTVTRTWAEPESNRRPPPHQGGALPPELSAGASRKSACLSSPGMGLDAHAPRRTCVPLWTRLVPVSHVSTRPLITNDVVYATRLPFGPASSVSGDKSRGAASYVEGSWARCSTVSADNWQAKVTRTYTRAVRRQTVLPFLS